MGISDINRILSIGAEGMGVAARRIATSAHNVANVQGRPFDPHVVNARADSVDSASSRQSQGGSDTPFTRDTPPAPGVFDPVRDGVNLASERVEQILATHAFAANFRSVRAADDVAESLLSIKA